MLSRIVSGAVEFDAFFNGIPVRQDPCGDRWSCAPAIDSMLPLLLHREKGLRIAEWKRFLDAGEFLSQFFSRMGHERFERTLIHHRHYAALDAMAQQFAPEELPLAVVEIAVPRPASCLRLNVREHLGE